MCRCVQVEMQINIYVMAIELGTNCCVMDINRLCDVKQNGEMVLLNV